MVVSNAKGFFFALSIALLLALAAMLVASACGGEGEPAATATPTPTLTATPTPTPTATPTPTPTATPTPEVQQPVVPGATYRGSVAGGTVEFTVSADGTRLTAYNVTLTLGPGPCPTLLAGSVTITSEGEEGVWVGTPINNNTFVAFESDGEFFGGDFLAGGRAEGVLRVISTDCDSGELTWTATAP